MQSYYQRGYQPQQSQHPYSQYQAGPSTAIPSTTVHRPPQQQQYPTSSKKKANAHQKRGAPALIGEDGEEPSGDELDQIAVRDVSMARYKRNHDYFAEVFSPYSVSAIVPPPLFDFGIEMKDELATKKVKLEEEIEDIKVEHAEMIQKLKSDTSEFWKAYELLDDVSSLESIFTAQKRIEEAFSLKILPFQRVKVVELDLPPDEEPATKTDLSDSEPPPPPPQNDLDMAFEGFGGYGGQGNELDGLGENGDTNVTSEFGVAMDAFAEISSHSGDAMAGIVGGEGIDSYSYFTNRGS